MLLPEMHRGAQAERKMVGEPHLAQHAHAESRIIVVNIGIPLFARLGIDITIVPEFHILNVQPEQKAVMETPLVDIRPVLQFPGLGHSQTATEEHQHEAGKQSVLCVHTGHFHTLYNVFWCAFIAQIPIFDDFDAYFARKIEAESPKMITFADRLRTNNSIHLNNVQLWLM